MAPRRLDQEIDGLYQLPLADFTAARNALAKSGGADVRTLVKPSVPAWAVNQLYWRERKTYEALVAASDAVRQAHTAMLAGRARDVREAGKAHDRAVEQALKATVSLLAGDGHPVTDATRQGILTTLRALPSGDAPGRLSQTLQPGGFEMLAGLTVGGKAPRAARSRERGAAAPTRNAAGTKTPGNAAARARARAEVEGAVRRLKQAEQAARREEFESARAAREAEKIERRVAEARAAFEAAREALEEAEADVPAATRAREAARRRAEQAGAGLDAARAAMRAVEDRLAKLQ